jgi:hypothetical protein
MFNTLWVCNESFLQVGLRHNQDCLQIIVSPRNHATTLPYPIRRAHNASLPTQKDGGLVEHHPPRYVTDQGSRGFIPIRCKVKMDVRAAHLAVIFTACSSSHQTITEVDETAECHEREKDGLL